MENTKQNVESLWQAMGKKVDKWSAYIIIGIFISILGVMYLKLDVVSSNQVKVMTVLEIAVKDIHTVKEEVKENGNKLDKHMNETFFNNKVKPDYEGRSGPMPSPRTGR